MSSATDISQFNELIYEQKGHLVVWAQKVNQQVLLTFKNGS